jgi:gluconate 2-dehydrogenase gamma chain
MSDELNRRDALKAFSMVGFAAAIDVTVPQLERATNAIAELAQQQPAYVPKFFSRREWRTVRMLVDYIIPRDERSGSATDAKVPEFMDWILADSEASEGSRVSMKGGLAWLDRESQDRFGKTFVTASDADRRKILDDIAWPAKAPAGMNHGVAFFSRFRDMTASGFYSSAIGWKDVQYMGNVFHHWDGCPKPALDKLGVSYDLMNSRVGTK